MPLSGVVPILLHEYAALPPHVNVGVLALPVAVVSACVLIAAGLRLPKSQARSWIVRAISAVALGLASVACTRISGPRCDALDVPPGFCATEFAPNVGPVRHLAVSASGVAYAASWSEGRRDGGVVALADTNGDGRADRRERFGTEGGSGLVLRDSQLFLGTWSTVRRWTLARDRLVPEGDGDEVVVGMPETEHGARSLAIDGGGNLYVNVGVPSNACERDYPRRDFRGQEPCSELSTGGGVWRFRTDSAAQRFSIGARYATGLRHTVALTVDGNGAVWGAPHAIDHLHSWWPDAAYSREDAARLPSETLHRITLGGDYGFPYCMFDASADRYVVAPAYRGSGAPRSCDGVRRPEAVLDAHSAPLALQFYDGRAFPQRYRGGLFIALHGSLFVIHCPAPAIRSRSFRSRTGSQVDAQRSSRLDAGASEDRLASPWSAHRGWPSTPAAPSISPMIPTSGSGASRGEDLRGSDRSKHCLTRPIVGARSRHSEQDSRFARYDTKLYRLIVNV
jgi:glucose/arabinose dehydrogenase